MRHQILLIAVVFAVMNMDTFFAANIPNIPLNSADSVISAPWWVFWTDTLSVVDLSFILMYISIASTELSVLVLILCFDVLGKRFSASVRQLLFTGHTTTGNRSTPLSWGVVAFGMSMGTFVTLSVATNVLTGAIVATFEFMLLKSFQKLLQRIHDSRMLEVRASLR